MGLNPPNFINKSVSHLEGTCQATKFFHQEVFAFLTSPFYELPALFAITFFSLRFGLQSSLCQSPIRIKATPRDNSQKRAHSAQGGPEKLRLRTGSIWYLIPWLFYQSHRAPGPGSKDADNSSFNGCDSVPILSVVQCHSDYRFAAAPVSLCKHLLWHKQNSISHNVIGRS